MVKKLKKFISSLENSRVSFGGLLITFLCIILLRNFLEAFSDQDNYWTPVSFLANFIHFPMFYISLLLALAFFVRWLIGERIMSVTKIMLFFFPVILLAPIVDLLLSQGQGYNMSYLLGDFSGLIHKFITFSRGFSGRGATPGIRTELAVILFLLAAYLYLKTGKILLTLMGIIGSYVIIFVFGSLPSLITELWNLKGTDMITGELFAGNVLLHHFYSFNHKMSFVFYPILLIELGICFWMYDSVKFKMVVKNLRLFRVLHYLFMLGFGIFLGYKGMTTISFFDTPFPVLIIVASVCSVALAWWFALGINDLHDVETDKITNPTRPLVTGIITVNEYKSLNLLFIILSLIAAWLIRYPFFVAILLSIALSYIYSAHPFRLKRYAFLSTFILGLSSLLVCLAGVPSRDHGTHFRPVDGGGGAHAGGTGRTAARGAIPRRAATRCAACALARAFPAAMAARGARSALIPPWLAFRPVPRQRCRRAAHMGGAVCLDTRRTGWPVTAWRRFSGTTRCAWEIA